MTGTLVNGNLDISNTNITSLPSGLVIKGDLQANWTKITELPDDIIVGEKIDVVGSKIRKRKAIELQKVKKPINGLTAGQFIFVENNIIAYQC